MGEDKEPGNYRKSVNDLLGITELGATEEYPTTGKDQDKLYEMYPNRTT